MTKRLAVIPTLLLAGILALPCSAQSPLQGSSPAGPHEQRSERAKEQFERQTGHPHGWAGHVVDHVVPLSEGGADAPSNMQWQTVEEAKAKDKVECGGKKCGSHTHTSKKRSRPKSSGSHHGAHGHH